MHYISLGYFCSVASELEKYGLRRESSPFDWVISEFEGVISAIENRFADLLKEEDLVQDLYSCNIYINPRYGIKFFHDFARHIPLAQQLPKVQEKYDRRIDRFYNTIAEPTLFVRYISNEKLVDGVSEELRYIEKNYDRILALLKSFHPDNDILFIANTEVVSERIRIFSVQKDENDLVAREPFGKNPELHEIFTNADTPRKQENLTRYRKKAKYDRRIVVRAQRKLTGILKRHCLKDYIHHKRNG